MTEILVTAFYCAIAVGFFAVIHFGGEIVREELKKRRLRRDVERHGRIK